MIDPQAQEFVFRGHTFKRVANKWNDYSVQWASKGTWGTILLEYDNSTKAYMSSFIPSSPMTSRNQRGAEDTLNGLFDLMGILQAELELLSEGK